MTSQSQDYLLAGGAAELERLTLQARVWEPEAEHMLDAIGIISGSSCVDLGCGAMGLLEPLSRRVGAKGHVTGIDIDAKQLAAARMMVEARGLHNVEIMERDAYNTGLPDASFDFTHVRFVLAPVGRGDQLLAEMLRLTKPGGTVAIQEPDAASWSCYPEHESWNSLKEAIRDAFRRGGGDFDAGRRTYRMLREAGLEDVKIRAAVLAIQNQHPYMRAPLQFAISLRQRILNAGTLSEADLDRLVADCEGIINDSATVVMTFIVTQVWGRTPRV